MVNVLHRSYNRDAIIACELYHESTFLSSSNASLQIDALHVQSEYTIFGKGLRVIVSYLEQLPGFQHVDLLVFAKFHKQQCDALNSLVCINLEALLLQYVFVIKTSARPQHSDWLL